MKPIEGMPSDCLEVSRAMGLSHPSTVVSVVIPETGNHLLSQLMFMFEYNVRHGTVIGIVGAGGIGYYITTLSEILTIRQGSSSPDHYLLCRR